MIATEKSAIKNNCIVLGKNERGKFKQPRNTRKNFPEEVHVVRGWNKLKV